MVRQDLLFLESKQEYPSVSLILPFKLAMPDRLENKTRVNNAIKLVKKQLEEKQCSAADIDAVIKSVEKAVHALDYEAVDAQGVAIFANKSISKIYHVPVPVSNEQIVVSDRFAVRDILYALQQVPAYWVLVLSEKPSRLFYGVLNSLTEIIEPAQNAHGVDIDGFPYTYMPPDITSEDELYHGLVHKDARYLDDKKEKFFERVFKLAKRFLDVQQLPLFIVTTEKDHTLFERAANGYPIAGWLRGDYCKRSDTEIAPLIWPIVEDYLTQERQKKLTYFEEVARGTDSKHAEGFQAVMAAAKEGRVHELLIESTIEVPSDKVNELIDTVLHKGNGRVIFYPKDGLKKYGQVVAVLRY